MDTSDTRWANCTEDFERLRWARTRAGLTQAQFAEAVGMKRTAYLKYEAEPGSSAGHTPLKYEQARPWASKLKVRWEWLLDGEGLPWRDEASAAHQVAALTASQPPEDQQRILDMVKLMIRKAG